MIRALMTLLAILGAALPVDAAVQTKTVTYKHGDLECRGFVAWDDALSGKRPGVLVIHEWWGLDKYARERAEQLANLGYVAFAADMYGGGKTVEHPMDAGKMAGAVRANVQDWRKRASTALDVLKSQPQCDAKQLAAIGYCFGGSTALQLAYAGAELKAVASFHGALPTATTDEAKSVKARILICNGGADTFIPEQAIKDFRAVLDNAQAKYDFVSYPGVKHSFTVPDAGKHGIDGLKYDKSADDDSWKRLRTLLAEQFAQ